MRTDAFGSGGFFVRVWLLSRAPTGQNGTARGIAPGRGPGIINDPKPQRGEILLTTEPGHAPIIVLGADPFGVQHQAPRTLDSAGDRIGTVRVRHDGTEKPRLPDVGNEWNRRPRSRAAQSFTHRIDRRAR